MTHILTDLCNIPYVAYDGLHERGDGRVSEATRTGRGRLAAGCAALLLFALATGAAPAAAAGPFPYGPDKLELVDSERLSDRLVELHFRTPAVEGETGVRVLLPEGYEADPARRYPVLYLLHGCCAGKTGYRSWTDGFPLAGYTEGLPLIVVMPDSGPQAGYLDWYNGGAGGTPMWETYHLGQLLPWIDENFRTVASRQARAVAGLSMGGYGAMEYATRAPDLFVAAASWSGAVNTNSVFLQASAVTALADSSTPSDPTYAPAASVRATGPRATEEVRARGRNPWDLVENVRGLALTLRTGDGSSGGPGNACCGGGSDQTGDFVEMEVHEENVSFHRRLAELSIQHTWDDYGPGCHCVWYWDRDLREDLPRLMAVFADPPPPPSAFSYTSIDPVYDVYGWRAAIDRPALEFSELGDASRDGFTLRGSGTGTVTTPPAYAPGRVVDVELVRDGQVESEEATVGEDCRLRLTVPLGPGNPYQQYTPQARAHGVESSYTYTPGTAPYEDTSGTRVYTTRVRIAATRPGGCRR